jgi:hypothetical protein
LRLTVQLHAARKLLAEWTIDGKSAGSGFDPLGGMK